MPTSLTFIGGSTLEIALDLEEARQVIFGVPVRAGAPGVQVVKLERRDGRGHVYVRPEAVAYIEEASGRAAGFA